MSVTRRLARKLPRIMKSGRHWLRAASAGSRPDTRVIFVVGSQRSGTRLPLQIMDYSPEIATYSEGTSPYFERVLLQPLDYVAARVRRSPSPIVVLKPICETHRINELLDRFPRSKAIWIFRNYRAASLSGSVKWTSGREALARLVARNFKAAGWRAGGLTNAKLAVVDRLYREDMSLFEAEMVMWYLRNGLFFDLGADRRADVLLVRYEDLIGDPRRRFAEMFQFIGTPMPRRAVEAIREAVGRERSYPDIQPDLRAVCEDMHARLLKHYQEQTSSRSVTAGFQAGATAKLLTSQ